MCSNVSVRKLGLLDHLVGAQQDGRRHLKPECPGGLKIENELKSCRLHNWQISGLLALQNTPSVGSNQRRVLRTARAVAHKTASGDKFAPFVKRWNAMTRGKCNEFVADNLKML